MELSRRVSILQETLGLSVSAFAKRAGLSPSTVKGIISEDTHPRMATINALCDAYNVTAEFFFAAGIDESVLRYVAKFNSLSTRDQEKFAGLLDGTYSPVNLFTGDYCTESFFTS
jgi:transcriptional regulator with XRE-family HTH domain